MTNFYTSAIQWGNNILVRGYKNGHEFRKKVQFCPKLYTPVKKETAFKTFDGRNASELSFDTISDAKKYVKTYEDVEGVEIFGMQSYNYQWIADEYPGKIDYDVSKMRIYAIDIEVAPSETGFPDPTEAKTEILLISHIDLITKKNVVFGFKSYTGNSSDFEFRQYDNEEEMLREYLIFWQQNYPDIVTGWNIDGFDIPYIINRYKRVFGEKTVAGFSPWGNISSKEKTNKHGQTFDLWDIQGVAILDYQEVYRKFVTQKKVSYKLGDICQEEIGDTKKELEGSFAEQIEYQWDAFVEYNAHDSLLISKLNDKLKFIELSLAIVFLTKSNITDIYSPSKTWDNFIYNFCKERNIVIPPKNPQSKEDFEGAWVKEPMTGLFGWCVSVDAKALYPTVIRQWNMSPETLVGATDNRPVEVFMDGTVSYDDTCTVAVNGMKFRKDVEGIIPQVIKIVMDGRDIAKAEMLHLEQEFQISKDDELEKKIAALNMLQLGYKIFANSLYGCLSLASFRYYELRIAEAITLTGQVSTRHVVKVLNEYMNKLLKTDKDYILMGDTDSCVLNVDRLVKNVCKATDVDGIVKWLDKLVKTQIKPILDKSTEHIAYLGNCDLRLMNYKREFIGSQILLTGKKRYAVKVHNSEGVDYKPYKLKIMGMDIVRSSTPAVVRDYLKKSLLLVLDGDQTVLHDYVAGAKAEFLNLPVEECASPRTANDIGKWIDPVTLCKKGTPIHVRGSIAYNVAMSKDKTVQPIANGDRIKFIYLKVPNTLRENVIAFPSHTKLPQELNLDKYIDRALQWEKTFISPLDKITGVIGWSPEKRASLESFFS